MNKGIYQIVKKTSDLSVISQEVGKFFDNLIASSTNQADKLLYEQLKTSTLSQVGSIGSPWFRSFLVFDPRPILQKTTLQPVLGLWGSKDLQVPGAENYAEMKRALELGKNEKFNLHILNGLNHLFQNSTTGSPSEYENIEESFSVEALHIMSEWILKETKSEATRLQMQMIAFFLSNLIAFKLFQI